MNAARRIAKNTFFLFLSNIFQKFLSLFIVIFVAQKLGVGDFGVYSFVFSFALLFTVLGDFGITNFMLREIAKDKSKAERLLGDAIIIKIALSGLVFAVVFLIAFALHLLLPATYPMIMLFLILLAVASMLLDSLAGLFRTVFFSFEKMELDFLANIAYKGVLFAAAFSVLLLGFGLWELVFVTVLASLLNLIVSFFLCAKKICMPKIHLDFAAYKTLLLASLPFCLIWLFSSVYGNIDMVLLSFLKGNVEVAYYSAAVRLVNALAFIPTALMSSLFPVFAVLFSQKNNSLGMVVEKSIKYLLVIIVPVAIGTTMLSHRIIAAIYPTTVANNFAPATIALQILIWFSLLNFVNLVFMNALSSTAFEKRTSLLLGATMLINLIANLILIPMLGFAGAAISMVISEGFFFVAAFSATAKRLHKINFSRVFAKPVAAALVMAAFIWFFSAIHLYALIILAAIVYFAAILVLRTFDSNDYLILSKVLIGKR